MFSRELKLKLFNEITKTKNFLGKYEDSADVVSFINKIWNLKELPSQDSRYKNALEDTYQHFVNNDDWPLEYLFLDRFKLVEGEDFFFELFIELIVNPTVRNNRDEILLFVNKINSIISESGFKLILTSYFEDLPVYR